MNDPILNSRQRLDRQRRLPPLLRQGVRIACVIAASAGCATPVTHYYSERNLNHIDVGDDRPHVIAMFEPRTSGGRTFDGLKIRSRRRDPAGDLLEVGVVTLINPQSMRKTPYRFLFKNGRLAEWSRAGAPIPELARAAPPRRVPELARAAPRPQVPELARAAPPHEARRESARAEPLYKRVLRPLNRIWSPLRSLPSVVDRIVADGLEAIWDPFQSLWDGAPPARQTAPRPAPPAVARNLASSQTRKDLAENPPPRQVRSDYANAEPVYERASPTRHQASASEPPAVARSLASSQRHRDLATNPTTVGAPHRARSEYANAEPLDKRALPARNQALGSEPPAAPRSFARPPASFQTRGRYARAEPSQQRAPAVREQAPSSDYPAATQSLTRLASFFQAQGHYARAEMFLKWALDVQEKALGATHPALVTSLENYALLLRQTGRWAQAEKMEARANAIRTALR